MSTECIANELDDLAKSFKLSRLKKEKDYYKKMDYEYHKEKIENIEKAINSLENIPKENKNKIQDAFSKIDKYLYMKPWKKLPNFHKNVKIKEYICDHYKDKTNEQRSFLENLLSEALLDTTSGINNNVIYDLNICKITAIPILKEDGDSYVLQNPIKTKSKSKIKTKT